VSRIFCRCFGWKGLLLLQSPFNLEGSHQQQQQNDYGSIENNNSPPLIYTDCIEQIVEHTAESRLKLDNDKTQGKINTGVGTAAQCYPLENLLHRAGMHDIDLLIINSENIHESAMVNGFPFKDSAISHVIVKTRNLIRHREIDVALTEAGFAKVALFGDKDDVHIFTRLPLLRIALAGADAIEDAADEELILSELFFSEGIRELNDRSTDVDFTRE
jgi:hypothetical protein